MGSNMVSVDYQGRIAILRLNKPRRLNAMDFDDYYALGQAMREVDSKPEITITVLVGTGRFFSAGADLQSAVASAGDDTPKPAADQDLRRGTARTFVISNIDLATTFSRHSKILVVALNGPAVGLSAAITALADFIYAAPHAFLLTPFAALGLVAEGVASRALVQRLGVGRANEALIMGRRIPSEELLAAGYVNKIIDGVANDDSEGFLRKVLAEVDERLGLHLVQDSMLKIKELIRAPERDIIDQQNVKEAFMGLSRFVDGIPQEQFFKIATGQKKHKL